MYFVDGFLTRNPFATLFTWQWFPGCSCEENYSGDDCATFKVTVTDVHCPKEQCDNRYLALSFQPGEAVNALTQPSGLIQAEVELDANGGSAVTVSTASGADKRAGYGVGWWLAAGSLGNDAEEHDNGHWIKFDDDRWVASGHQQSATSIEGTGGNHEDRTFIAWYKGVSTNAATGAYNVGIAMFGDPRNSVYLALGTDRGRIAVGNKGPTRGDLVNTGTWEM
jgi:hypothetical protein